MATPAAPQPPCGRDPVPAYPGVTQPPAANFWDPATIGRAWHPPECTGWSGDGFASLVTVAARFRVPADPEAVLRRVGAISQLAGMRYWSTTHQRWQTLITESHALSGPSGAHRRSDFAPSEIVPGAVLYYEQTDNLAGRAVYRLRFISASETRIVFEVENITTMHYLLLPIFHPLDLQTIYFLDRESPDVWNYYSMSRTGLNASALTKGKPASSINRSIAFFRHFAGIPTDLDPPAAR